MKKVKVSTYAKMIGKTPQWVYYLINTGQVKAEQIDGVWFVNTNVKKKSA